MLGAARSGSSLPALAAGAASVTWALLLCVGALAPDVPRAASAVPDWLAHSVGYGVQGGLVRVWLHLAGRRRHAFLWSVGAAVLLGVATELLQGLHPARSAEIRDLTANAVGALAIVGGVSLALRFLRRDGEDGGS